MMLRTSRLLVLAAALSAGAALAQAVPPSISFAGRLLDDGGNPLAGTRTFVFTLYNSADAATGWSETHSNVTVDAGGLVYLDLGSIEPFDFVRDIDGGELSLGISVDGGAEMTPRIPIRSVPYAFMADYAANADIAANTDLLDGYDSTDFLMPSDSLAWANLTGVPASLASMPAAACAGGEFLVGTSAGWLCSALSCPAGEAIRGINVDGDVICEVDDVGAAGSNCSTPGTCNNIAIRTGSNGNNILDTVQGLATTDPLFWGDRAVGLLPIDWSDLTSVPSDLLDGDADTLGMLGTGCVPGEVAVADGAGNWSCAPNETVRICGSGEVLKSDGGGNHYCAPDEGLITCGVDLRLQSTGSGWICAPGPPNAGTALLIEGGNVISVDLPILDNRYVQEGEADIINTTMIQDGTIGAIDLAANSVDINKIRADSVDSSKVADNTLQSADIMNGTLQDADFTSDPSFALAPSKVQGTAATLTGDQNFGPGALFVDANNRRIGVRTATPTTEVDVVGAVTANGYNFNPAPTFWTYVSASEFIGEASSNNWHLGAGWLQPVSLGQFRGWAPLRLPQGASILRLFCHYWDGSNVSYFFGGTNRAWIWRRDFSFSSGGGVNSVTWSTLAATVHTSAQTVEVTLGSPYGVDNSSEQLMMLVELDAEGGTTNLRFYGCGVEYQLGRFATP